MSKFGHLAIVLTVGALPFVSGVAPAVPVSVPALRTPNVPETPFGKAMKDGFGALASKQLDKAQESFRQAAKLDPKSAEPLLGLAETAKLKGDAASAEHWIKQALAAAPDSVQAQLALGRLRYAAKRYAEAETQFRKALSLDSKSLAAHLDLGELYLNALRKPKESADAFRQATALDPRHAGAQHGLGMALAAQGQNDAAAGAFSRAIELAPGMPLPYQALARVHVAKGERHKAIEVLGRLLKLSPSYVPALLDRGDLHFAQRDWGLAAGDYAQAVKHAPGNANAHFKLGLAYQSAGKPADAIRAYRASLAADGRFVPPYNNLAWLLAERKENLDEALKLARRAVEFDARVGVLYATLGQVHRARGEKSSAIEALRKAVALEPKQPVFRYRLGIALAENGNEKEALAAFRDALGLRKDFAEAADASRWVSKLGG